MNNNTAQNMAMIAENKLGVILAAIRNAASQGKRSLSLYEYHLNEFGGYQTRVFNYGDEEIEQLKALGYKVDTSAERKSYRKGFLGLFGEKVEYTKTYHTIKW